MKQHHFSYEELGAFCLSLAHLIRAGISTGDALHLMAQDEPVPWKQALLQHMRDESDEGARLASLLEESGVFPAYVSTMVRTGEESGRLEEALFALSDFYESRAQLDRQLRAALFQPVLLLGILLVVIAVLLGWVLPVFQEVYQHLGTSLTGIAGGLLALGNGLRAGAPVLAAAALALCAALFALTRSEQGRMKLLSALSRQEISRSTSAAHLTQVLAMAMTSGLDPESGLQLALTLEAEDPHFHSRCESCLQQLRQGSELPDALRETQLLSAAQCRLLEAGCRSGSADTVMAHLAQQAQKESEGLMQQWLERVEPGLVLLSSALIGVVLFSVLLPLTQIMSAIG